MSSRRPVMGSGSWPKVYKPWNPIAKLKPIWKGLNSGIWTSRSWSGLPLSSTSSERKCFVCAITPGAVRAHIVTALPNQRITNITIRKEQKPPNVDSTLFLPLYLRLTGSPKKSIFLHLQLPLQAYCPIPAFLLNHFLVFDTLSWNGDSKA